MYVVQGLLKLRVNLSIIRKLSTTIIPNEEISIPVPWGEVRGKYWGSINVRPILMLHGWQDNCATFDRLIPLLDKNMSFLCIDMPGHGYSSRLPNGIYYNYDTAILTIRRIKNYLNWKKISLMGHSLGGITSYTFTMLYPEEVDFLICIDGAKPTIPMDRLEFVKDNFNIFIKNEIYSAEHENEEPPSYSMEEIKRKIHESNRGSISLDHADLITKRNLSESKTNPGKFYFHRDPRLKAYELFVFGQHELVEYAKRIKCPFFVTKSTKASYYEPKENFYQILNVVKSVNLDYDFHYVNGTHHAHLNNPEEFAMKLNKFLKKHYKIEERKNEAGIERIIKLENNFRS